MNLFIYGHIINHEHGAEDDVHGERFSGANNNPNPKITGQAGTTTCNTVNWFYRSVGWMQYLGNNHNRRTSQGTKSVKFGKHGSFSASRTMQKHPPWINV